MFKKQKSDIQKLDKINRLLRYWILDMTTEAGSGHATSSLSAVELMSTLMFSGAFRYDINNINNIYNDRLIFSKGHASPLFYALWAAADAIKVGELSGFRKFDSVLEGHPTMRFPFTEAATGSLGQGLSVGVGIALAQKNLDKTKSRTFILLGDSEMAEGQAWEAMNSASHYELGNLIAIVDVNRLGQRGETMFGHNTEEYEKRAKAFGWRTVIVDGHNTSELMRVYTDIVGEHKKPLMIIAKTYKGRGVSFLEDKYSWHGKALSKQEFTEAIDELGDIDFDIRGKITSPTRREMRPKQLYDAYINECNFDPQKQYATRDAYGEALVEIMKEDKKVVVLDAEVSNSTRSEKVKEVFPERFFEMFIAEQNMVSVAVGLSRCGYKPFISSFAAFLTRAHDQIRMAQFSDSNITIIGSHAGVSIGEDGGSQMGLGDIAMFRAILGSKVLYPSDFVSAQKILSLAYGTEGISYVRMTREKTPVIYEDSEQFMLGGLKVLRQSKDDSVVIISAGITVHETLKAYQALQVQDIAVRVIDLYSIKPVDEELLHETVAGIKNIIVVEDHYIEGGISEAVQTALGRNVLSLAVRNMPRSGKIDELLQYEKIDAHAIINVVQGSIK